MAVTVIGVVAIVVVVETSWLRVGVLQDMTE